MQNGCLEFGFEFGFGYWFDMLSNVYLFSLLVVLDYKIDIHVQTKI